MRRNLLSTTVTPMSTSTTHHHHLHRKHSSSSSSSSSSNPNPNNSTTCTHHPPSATLDLLILILVLFSGAFLLSSYLSYIFHSLSLILPPISFPILHNVSSIHLIGLFIFLVLTTILCFEICCGNRSRKCGKRGCKGMKKAMEFDLQMQSEEEVRGGGKRVKEIDELPWKGGSEMNVDYECLRTELRKMAPVNGRAVLLFRAKCGCPVAKLEGWGPKRGRRNKKILSLNAGNHG